ncbi:YsnF/AvaK domain-containing protein [Roseicella sp. DB1501]|uniref:YsnF/AvaK domain-containing protein n=1 Tax=Roseicella sp. DB1501 TaxID=2730925 RepID=UPI001490EF09|nr:YsnF/AvaK domain-containing protein [Roseicella sp. DB1501]NOG74173.1 YsnF/AvaK domain-containing protein [Roseicella sp. DB1501]
MTRTITAMFDDRAQAEAAVRQLTQELNIDRDLIQVYAADTVATTTRTTVPDEDRGFWASLKDLFVPDEDRYTYAEGMRRGGVVVSAEVEDGVLDHAMTILENNDAIDLDSREAEWRQSGWTGYQASGGTDAAVASSPSAPVLGIAAVGTTPPAASTSAPVTTAATATSARPGGEEVIPIVEEQVRVGKRDVERGRVRVRSYVVETPVTEQVNLRDERVEVERRAVDRPLTDADNAFRERTIEATETDEEAVVSKQARVVEELVIRKDATERTETVQDTVRRTEVEVDDTTGAPRTGGNTGLAGTVNPPGTEASRAVDEVLGTNVSGARPDQADGTPGNPPGTMASRAVDNTLGTNISGTNPSRKS